MIKLIELKNRKMKEIDIIKKKMFFALVENELDIYYNFEHIKGKSLKQLDVTRPEIDLFLNQLEQTYGIEIREENVSLDITFNELVEKIIATSVVKKEKHEFTGVI